VGLSGAYESETGGGVGSGGGVATGGGVAGWSTLQVLLGRGLVVGLGLVYPGLVCDPTNSALGVGDWVGPGLVGPGLVGDVAYGGGCGGDIGHALVTAPLLTAPLTPPDLKMLVELAAALCCGWRIRVTMRPSGGTTPSFTPARP